MHLWYQKTAGFFQYNSFVYTKNGLSYHDWDLNGDDQEDLTMNDVTTIRFCLMLPKLSSKGFCSVTDPAHYAVIDSEWQVMQDDTSFHYCKVPNASYTR